MQRTKYITMVCFAFVLLMNGQGKKVVESNLYGDWSINLYENEQNEDECIFKKEKDIKQKGEETLVKISLLEKNEYSANFDSAGYFCGSETSSFRYSWVYNEDLSIVIINKSDQLLKEWKERDPENFKEWNVPENYIVMELKLVKQDNGSIGLEIIDWN